MANVKISNFSEQDDVSLIEGFAGYQGTASKSNIRISGNKLKLWLQNNLDFATASGTTNYLAKFTSTGTLGDSLIRDDGTYVGIFAAPKANSGVFIDFRETQAFDRGVEVDSLGQYGITSRAYNNSTGSPVDKIGVYGQALDSEDKNIGVQGFANAVNSTLGSSYAIGGAFKASNGDFTYSVQLEDGTEGVGKFLKSITADGHANWSALPITVTSLTLVDGPTSTGDGLSLTSNASGDYTLSMHAYGGDTFKGFVPTGGSSSNFLRGDGTWVAPTNTTYTAGDGLTLTGTVFSTDLKANGGLVIESAELAVDLSASAITGTLASDNGGTGFSTYAKGDLLYSSATNVLSKLSIGSTNEVLKVDASGVPVWGAEGGYTLPAATVAALGGIQLNVAASGSPIATNSPSSVGNRYYAVQIDSNNKAFVNIPWEDTNTTYTFATTQNGGVNTDPNLTLTGADPVSSANIQLIGDGPITITRQAFPPTLLTWDINSFAGSAKGAVPSASAGDAGKFLKADGSWDNPTNTGLTSVGLVMPSAFSVTNSPLTSNGDITVAPLNATNGQYLDYLGEWSTPPTGDTYDLNATATLSGDVALNLTSTTGTDNSLIQLTEGTNITLTRNSATEITIDAAGGGSGNLDLSNIDASTIKADLTLSSQTQYGQAIKLKALGAISNGEPVIWDYTSGVVKAEVPQSTFTQQQAIGVALQDIANGATGDILISGFATVKYDGITTPFTGSEVVLDNSTNGNIITLDNSYTPFRAVSGGTGSYPSSAGPWTIKFDAGAGNTVKFEIVDFEFEHSSTSLYDRGGWVVSATQNGTYNNAQLTPGRNTAGNDGWLNSATSSVGSNVWSTSYGSSSATSGYIFPENPTTGNVNIGDVYDLGSRFAEYHFTSDGSSNFLGWDLKMISSGANLTGLSVGATMRADVNSGTFNRLTAGPGGPIFGYFVGGSTTNNAIVCRIAPPRPVN